MADTSIYLHGLGNYFQKGQVSSGQAVWSYTDCLILPGSSSNKVPCPLAVHSAHCEHPTATVQCECTVLLSEEEVTSAICLLTLYITYVHETTCNKKIHGVYKPIE